MTPLIAALLCAAAAILLLPRPPSATRRLTKILHPPEDSVTKRHKRPQPAGHSARPTQPPPSTPTALRHTPPGGTPPRGGTALRGGTTPSAADGASGDAATARPRQRAPTYARAGATHSWSRRDVLLQRTSATLAGLATAALIGGAAGLAAGAIAACTLAVLLKRLEPREHRRRRLRLIADLPLAVDLLAACLRGGSSWLEAVEAVADAIGGPLAEELSTVAAQVKLGADPAAAWLTLAHNPALAPLARTAARATQSGASLAPTLARLARDQRRTAHATATARARTAGIQAVAPLGLCFLPAFVLLGITPAIAGLATTTLLP